MASEPPAWRPAWQAIEPYARFVRLLSSHYGAIRSNLGSEDAEDLYQEFVTERLPKLLERLEKLPERDRERYLVVVFRNFVREHLRSATRYRRALDALGALPREPEESPEQERELAAPALSPVLREYFGPDGSLRGVAKAFGLTRHQARRAVVDETLALALHHGSTDDLSNRDRTVCWRILLEGNTVEEAAAAAGITESQARAALARARARINQRLIR